MFIRLPLVTAGGIRIILTSSTCMVSGTFSSEVVNIAGSLIKKQNQLYEEVLEKERFLFMLIFRLYRRDDNTRSPSNSAICKILYEGFNYKQTSSNCCNVMTILSLLFPKSRVSLQPPSLKEVFLGIHLKAVNFKF